MASVFWVDDAVLCERETSGCAASDSQGNLVVTRLGVQDVRPSPVMFGTDLCLEAKADGKDLTQPSNDPGKPLGHHADESRCKEREDVMTKANNDISDTVLEEHWDNPQIETAGPNGTLGDWLANTLRSQRISVEAMLEQQHEAMLHELSSAFELQKSNFAVPVHVDLVNGSKDAQSYADPTQETPTSATCAVTDEQMWRPLGLPVEGRSTLKRQCHFEICERVASHAQKLDSHLRQQFDRSKPTIHETLTRWIGDGWGGALRKFASIFELCIGGLISVNLIVMAFELQYEGFDIGYYHIGYDKYRPARETWPGGAVFFENAEWIFGVVFALECVVMLCILRLRFFRSPWHVFDVLVVCAWVTLRLEDTAFFVDPMLLRIARLMRLARILRILRFFAVFDALHLILKSISASMLILCWSLLLLCLVIMVSSLVVSQLVSNFMRDETHPLEDRFEVFQQWGSFTRSTETMFEITLGNWGPPCRLLQNKVHEAWMVFFVGYKCIIGFAVVQVITSVFIQQTFKVVAQDEEMMINEKKIASERYLKNLENLFQVIDVSEDGHLSHDELVACLSDTTVQAWFEALDINVQEASTLFNLIDNGDGAISRKEFIQGMRGIRGNARSVDIKSLMKEVKIIRRSLKEVKHHQAILQGNEPGEAKVGTRVSAIKQLSSVSQDSSPYRLSPSSLSP
eukprot:TRINITY_DN9741_c0_g2_i2.p1 TRINITY_DN9741_c0_g2~~TRINITY_DN9741_c0_g2_i2.p1  ORF type:complete len:686 (-),score=109.33 TRINITY_DN9741_c0_g2_i2:132-2189(-)